jgi:nucleotide-binding universal stress UspA family protein
MTYNAILVQLDIDGPTAQRLSFARDLARRFDAELIGFSACNVRPIMAAPPPGAVLDGEFMRLEAEEIGRRLEALKEEFETEVGSARRTSWRSFVGDPTRALAKAARAADLIVAGRPSTASVADAHRAIDLGELVLSAGRPVLVPADDGQPLNAERVLVAWKDTREARRAIVDALPFLVDAREVLVATIEHRARDEARDSALDVAGFLKSHGATATADVVGHQNRDDGAVLAARAKEIGADLIVSGAYGHSRLREWAFGGVTRSLLREGSVSRLMSY